MPLRPELPPRAEDDAPAPACAPRAVKARTPLLAAFEPAPVRPDPPEVPWGAFGTLAREAVVAPLTMPELRAGVWETARCAVVAPRTIPPLRAEVAAGRAIPDAPPRAKAPFAAAPFAVVAEASRAAVVAPRVILAPCAAVPFARTAASDRFAARAERTA